MTTADSDNASVRKAIIGSCIGVGLLVLLLVLAIFNANSVLAWMAGARRLLSAYRAGIHQTGSCRI